MKDKIIDFYSKHELYNPHFELLDAVSDEFKVLIIKGYISEECYPRDLTIVYVNLDSKNKTISKFDCHYEHIKFSKEELNFFDVNDFEIHDKHCDDIDQDISDWV